MPKQEKYIFLKVATGIAGNLTVFFQVERYIKFLSILNLSPSLLGEMVLFQQLKILQIFFKNFHFCNLEFVGRKKADF